MPRPEGGPLIRSLASKQCRTANPECMRVYAIHCPIAWGRWEERWFTTEETTNGGGGGAAGMAGMQLNNALNCGIPMSPPANNRCAKLEGHLATGHSDALARAGTMFATKSEHSLSAPGKIDKARHWHTLAWDGMLPGVRALRPSGLRDSMLRPHASEQARGGGTRFQRARTRGGL